MPKKDKRFKNSDRQPRIGRRQLDSPDYASGVGIFMVTSVMGNGRECYAQFLNCCPEHERDDFALYLDQYPDLRESSTRIILRMRDLRMPRSFKLEPNHTIVAAMIPSDLRLGSWNAGNVMTGIILKVYDVSEVNELRHAGYIPMRIAVEEGHDEDVGVGVDRDEYFEHDAEDLMAEVGVLRAPIAAAAGAAAGVAVVESDDVEYMAAVRDLNMQMQAVKQVPKRRIVVDVVSGSERELDFDRL